MREGDGDGRIVGVGGRVELRSVRGVVVPLVSIQSQSVSGRTVIHAGVVVVWRSVLLDVVGMVVGVRSAQHQPPAQSGEARNWGVRDRRALHAAGDGLGR